MDGVRTAEEGWGSYRGDILGSIGADGRFGGRSAGAFGGADGGLQWL